MNRGGSDRGGVTTEEFSLHSLDVVRSDLFPLGLRVLYSDDSREFFKGYVLRESLIHIGRERSCLGGIILCDSKVSRLHASVRWSQRLSTHMIIDEGSRNGTFVNGVRIKDAVLKKGDIIRIGNTIFCYDHLAGSGVMVLGRGKERFIGISRSTAEVISAIKRVSSLDLNVLLLGETGTGKELIARLLHLLSGRRGEFVSVDCASIPCGLVESELFGHLRGAFSGAIEDRSGLVYKARNGTLFLDEIGNISLEVQAKLLRLIEQKEVRPIGSSSILPVDCRIIAATNLDLKEAVKEGRFRGDLFARLNDWTIDIPPLRNRPQDIVPLLQYFLGQAAPSPTPDFIEALLIYKWPFNVRELKKTLNKVKILSEGCEKLELAMLPPDIQHPIYSRKTKTARRKTKPSKAELQKIIAQYNGNMTKIAKHYQRERIQIYRWLKSYKIKPS